MVPLKSRGFPGTKLIHRRKVSKGTWDMLVPQMKISPEGSSINRNKADTKATRESACDDITAKIFF